MPLAAESHVDRSINRPRRLRAHQRHRHAGAARRGARALRGVERGPSATPSASSTSPPTRSTARSRRDSSPRTAATTALALLGVESRLRPPRASLHETYGLPVLVTNCSNNYGPRHFPEKLIPLMILNALEGKEPACLRRRDERARLDPRRGPRQGLVAGWSAGALGQTYLLGGRGGAQQPRRGPRALRRLRPAAPRGRTARAADHLRRRPPRPRPPLRHRLHQGGTRTGWAPQKSFEAALEETVAWVTSPTRRGGARSARGPIRVNAWGSAGERHPRPRRRRTGRHRAASPCWPDGVRVHAPTREALDITDAAAVEAALSERAYAAVINTAAYTAVDKAEGEVEARVAPQRALSGDPGRRDQVPKDPPRPRLSTDYRLRRHQAGGGLHARRPVDPRSVYGASKAAGEMACAPPTRATPSCAPPGW